MLIIDSSTIIKFVSRESGWEDAQHYVSEASTIQLALVELGSGMRKKIRNKEIDTDIALQYIRDYSKSAILLDDRQYAAAAFEISIKKNISVYDCFFVAAALQEGYDLVSSDRNQLEVAKELGIKAISVGISPLPHP